METCKETQERFRKIANETLQQLKKDMVRCSEKDRIDMINE